jgi:two-component system LytT family sensor kinase
MNKKLLVLLHIVLWGIILVMPISIILNSQTDISIAVKVYVLYSNGFILIPFYVSFFFLKPINLRRYSLLRNILIFLLIGLGLYSVKFGISHLLDNYFENTYTEERFLTPIRVFYELVNTWMVMLIALLIRISVNWFGEQKQKSDMILQQQTQELALLKAQLNPHFFFNTLNNIYSLVYKKSDDAPAALLKLSEIMRYMLYESKSDTVPLFRELEHLENYLELEKLRLKDPDFISFEIEGDISNKMVPPMLLLSFVENAFKHGKKRVENPGIIIRLKVQEDQVDFMVTNYTLDENQHPNEHGGIGLQNTSRRLELLYPNSHSLKIVNESDQYVVDLKLKSNPSQIN